VEELQLDFGCSYSELQKDGFPFRLFVNPDFTISLPLNHGSPPVPISQFWVLFITGGFILFTHLHYSYCDAKGADAFLLELSDATRSLANGPEKPQLDLETMNCDISLPHSREDLNLSFSELL
jgi:hypothetical protein